MEGKFKKGDGVRIIKYRHLRKSTLKDGSVEIVDLRPRLVGMKAIVEEVNLYYNQPFYKLDFGQWVEEKWFNEGQMELTDRINN